MTTNLHHSDTSLELAKENILTFQYDGKGIKTNYFQTEDSKQGRFFLSNNAQTLFFLVPNQHSTEVKQELTRTEYFILYSGRAVLPAFYMGDISQAVMHMETDSYELIFEDNGDTPLCLRFSIESTDKIIIQRGKWSDIKVVFEDGSMIQKRFICLNVTGLPCERPLPKAFLE